MKRIALSLALWAFFTAEGFAETWMPVSSGTSQTINTLFFVSPDTGWIAGENSLIRKTTDGGASWTAQSGSGTIKTIKFANSKVGWAVGESAGAGLALKTTDGGATWTPQINSGPVLWDVQIANEYPDHVWIAGEGGFLRQTTDGGTTWPLEIPENSWSLPYSGTILDIHRLWLHNDGIISGIIGPKGLIRILMVNEGDTLKTVDSHTTNDLMDLSFPGIHPRDSGWCVGAYGTILRTTDGGYTWAAQNSGVATDLFTVSFVTSLAGYAAGANGVLLKTTDGGETWVTVSSGTTNGIHAAGISLGTGGWFAGDLGTVAKQNSVEPLYLAYGNYPGYNNQYTVGFSIKPVVPKIMASAPIHYAVSPALPDGLILNSNTGIVSGTPTTVTPAADYVITATNDLGSLTVPVRITILTPPTLTYSVYPTAQYFVGTPIAANVTNLQKPNMTYERYAVTPALPAGLKLDSVRGGITGTPTVASPSTAYLITATISNGTWVSVTLNITVLQRPANLSYSQNTADYPASTAITPNIPSLLSSEAVRYSVSDPLPAGLTLDSTTGIISGTPTTPTESGFYLVTASNSMGSTSRVLVLTVSKSTALGRDRSGRRDFGFTAPGGAGIRFEVPEAASRARVEIVSFEGRRLWASVLATTLTTTKEAAWNGRNLDGNEAPSGVYGIRIVWIDHNGKPVGSAVRRFTLLRD